MTCHLHHITSHHITLCHKCIVSLFIDNQPTISLMLFVTMVLVLERPWRMGTAGRSSLGHPPQQP
jgi:hypothetical protein